MSKRFILIEEKQAKRPKALKDRFTLMPTINTTGDALLKPLPVSHSENLRALNGIDNNIFLFCFVHVQAVGIPK